MAFPPNAFTVGVVVLGLLSSSSVEPSSPESINTGTTFFFGVGTTTHSSSEDEVPASTELVVAADFVDTPEALLAPGLSAALETFTEAGLAFMRENFAAALPKGGVDRGLALNSGVKRRLAAIGDSASAAVE